MRKREATILLILFLIPAASWGKTEGEGYESSLICESCHSRIYEEWKGSYHAASWEDSLFQDLYAAVKAKNDDVDCLNCHAPVAVETGDRMVMKAMSREGINCDNCHGLQGLRHLGVIKGSRIKSDRIKVGRVGKGTSIYHGIRGEESLGSAEFCATCHHLRNRHGVLIYSEFESWKKSPYAASGKTCHDCHMPVKTARASNYGPVRDDISDHRFTGWRSIGMLRSACSFKSRLSVSDKSVRITTEIRNKSAGHKFPGGSPLRELVVRFVGLNSTGRELFQNDELRYGVRLEVPEDDSLNIWEARSILEDTRILPRKKRIATTSLPLVEGLTEVEVSLLFYPIPLDMVKEKELEEEPTVIYQNVLKVRKEPGVQGEPQE
jgi:nitrate/TMAO reductase-like tetraheme cytochrome c subunit